MRIVAGHLARRADWWRPPAQTPAPPPTGCARHCSTCCCTPPGAAATREGGEMLDAFAGTGALGLEALSRGAAHATFMETDRAALATLSANIAACRAADRATVLAADATRPPPGGRAP